MRGSPFPYPDRLRTAMSLLGWDVQTLARESGINRETASKVVDGRPVDSIVIPRVLAALHRNRGELDAALDLMRAIPVGVPA